MDGYSQCIFIMNTNKTVIKKGHVFFRIVKISLVMLLGILAGCAGSQDVSKETLVANYTVKIDKSAEISELNAGLFSSAQMNVDPSDYLLGAGDLLEVTVFEAEKLGSKVRVSSRGYVTLPLLGQVLVNGLTAREAEEKIEDLYKNTYIKDPHVSVFVEEHFSQRVTVVGEIKKPGTYDYPSKQRLLDVLALAGGLTEKAGITVQIRRIGSTPEQKGSFIVDLDKLIKEGRTEFNIEINGGDIVFVPEAGSYFVDGAIRRPGSYLIKQEMVIREALLAAGGLAPYAKRNELTLIRYCKNGKRNIMDLDFEKHPEEQELEVKDRDVIIVGASSWGKIVHGTGLNIGIPGVFGFGYRSPEK